MAVGVAVNEITHAFSMVKSTTKLPYKLARLVNYKGDLSQRWYVIFYVWDASDNKLKRKRYFGNINSFKTKSERTKEANKLIKIINEALVDDYIIGTEILQENTPFTTVDISVTPLTVKEAIQEAVSIKSQSERKRTRDTYSSLGNIFNEYISKNKIDGLPIINITSKHILGFLDYLKLKEIKKGDKIQIGVSNTTRNNYLTLLRALFNALLEREIIVKNPCHKIKDLPEEKGKFTAFKEDEQLIIESWMLKNDVQLYYLTRFIYYSFIRPEELTQLQIGHIDLNNKRIHIPSSISKNGNQSSIVITKSLYKVIQKMKLNEFSRSYYVFSDDLLPGKNKIHRNRFTDRHRYALKATNLYNGELKLYSWKHTGVVNAYRAKVDMKTLQLHSRHHSLAMTDIYMRSFGLTANKELEDKEW